MVAIEKEYRPHSSANTSFCTTVERQMAGTHDRKSVRFFFKFYFSLTQLIHATDEQHFLEQMNSTF